MSVLKAKFDYWTDTRFANSPSPRILVDRAPKPSEYRYEFKETESGGRIYFAELNGFASFFFAKGPFEQIEYDLGADESPRHIQVYASKQDRGYAGRHFVLSMKNGEVHVLRGPWSSNAHAVQSVGFPICTEVSYTDDPAVWEKGYTFYAGAVTKDTMIEICEAADPPDDDDMHTWAWVQSKLGAWMPAVVKSSRGELTGAFYKRMD